jgi:hypothetical protein
MNRAALPQSGEISVVSCDWYKIASRFLFEPTARSPPYKGGCHQGIFQQPNVCPIHGIQ